MCSSQCILYKQDDCIKNYSSAFKVANSVNKGRYTIAAVIRSRNLTDLLCNNPNAVYNVVGEIISHSIKWAQYIQFMCNYLTLTLQ